ncbi:MAG: sugar phosphate isomerase/epimerase [Acidobacteria bacterium]|nr:sugar phosphate isomerase/epimerase [Acidobacteriota bacterium]
MYVSLNSATIQGRAPWPEFAHLAARVGYGGVDIVLGKAMGEGVDSTRALLAELKLKPAATGLPVEFRKDEATFQEGLKRLNEAGQFLKAIGCPRMATWIVASSDTPKAELRKLYKDRFTAISQVLRPTGVRVGLEFLGPLHLRSRGPHEFIWRMDEMLEFARECGPNMGLLLDSWHWHHAGATPADILAAGKSGIVHVHLAEAPKLPPEEIRDNERLIPGEGVIDWKGFLGALKKIGYEDGLSPEIFGRGLKDMTAEEAARLALKGSLEVLRQAGVL